MTIAATNFENPRSAVGASYCRSAVPLTAASIMMKRDRLIWKVTHAKRKPKIFFREILFYFMKSCSSDFGSSYPQSTHAIYVLPKSTSSISGYNKLVCSLYSSEEDFRQHQKPFDFTSYSATSPSSSAASSSPSAASPSPSAASS